MKALPATVVVCLLGLFCASAAAQEARLTLEYSAPEGCLTEEQFRDEVAARLGTIPFAEKGAPLLVTIVRQNKGGFLGTLELEGRERILRNADCGSLARDLAAALAVQLDAPQAKPQPSADLSKPAVAPAGEGTVSIDVQAEEPGLTLYVVRGQQISYGYVGGQAATAVGYQFESLCTAPCQVNLAPSDYHFAIGRGVNTPLPLDNRVRITAPSRVDLDYKSRRAVRIIGFVLGMGGSLGGLGLFVKGLTDESKPTMITGGVIMGGSLVVGLVMSMIGDKNSLELTPAQ
jgi:hypothetical protein